MRFFFFLALGLSLLTSCGSEIKNNEAKVVVEEGTEVNSTAHTNGTEKQKEESLLPGADSISEKDFLGFWVGDFEKADKKHEENIYAGESFVWNRNNKINISIDKIDGTTVVGHSVVAGNDRPFKGTMRKDGDKYIFNVKEPGNHKYDGEFNFTISNLKLEGLSLKGTWEAYKDVNTKRRKYALAKKVYVYNPNIMLERVKAYVEWNNYKEQTVTVSYEEGSVDEWIEKEFAASTDKIYEINASARLLTVEEVENLKKGDLTIIRNSIYARHGYSFKNQPLRVFFDAQSWYIPVHADIRSEFTDIEKKNIELLLRYEKNAAEYYDAFGRG